MKKVKKIISLVVLGVILTSSMISCSNKAEDQKTSIDYSKSSEEILLNYSEEGMNILKSNYQENDEMDIALKNIGRVPNQLEFKTVNDENIVLKEGLISELADKNIILQVSQAHCSHCLNVEEPVKNVLEEEAYSDIELIPIFVNSSKEAIDSYYKSLNIENPKYLIIDENKSVVSEFSLIETPSFIFIDKTGRISYIKTGQLDEVSFKESIDIAFNKEPIYRMINE